MDHASAPRHHRTRSLLAGLAVAAASALVVAACDVPAQPAGDLYDAWVANDHTAAAAVATPSAVSQMFSQAYSSTTGWFFDHCDGAAGSTFCTWITNIEGRMVLQITNSTQKVSGVTRTSLGNVAAGRVFHAWRIGNSSAGAPYATPRALFTLFAKPYAASDHWTPQGCDAGLGSLYCTWDNDAGKTIVFQSLNVQPSSEVGNVSGTFHP